jgi:hypothetical protein
MQHLYYTTGNGRESALFPFPIQYREANNNPSVHVAINAIVRFSHPLCANPILTRLSKNTSFWGLTLRRVLL